MEKVLNDEDAVKEKNKYLWPLFSDLKLMIRKISMTPENMILWDFNVAICKILASWADDEKMKKKAIEEVKKLFAVKLFNNENNKSYNDLLNDYYKSLMGMLHLLQIWNDYLDIIYMPSHEIELWKIKRMNPTYFSKDFDNKSIGSILKMKEEKGYETIDEAVTSDTNESEIEISWNDEARELLD